MILGVCGSLLMVGLSSTFNGPNNLKISHSHPCVYRVRQNKKVKSSILMLRFPTSSNFFQKVTEHKIIVLNSQCYLNTFASSSMNFYFLKNVTVLLPRIMSGSILPLQGMCLACVTSKGHAEHHGSLCCHLWPCGCLWGRLPLETILIALAHVPWEAMLMSLAYAAMESYDGFHGLSWSRRLC